MRNRILKTFKKSCRNNSLRKNILIAQRIVVFACGEVTACLGLGSGMCPTDRTSSYYYLTFFNLPRPATAATATATTATA